MNATLIQSGSATTFPKQWSFEVGQRANNDRQNCNSNSEIALKCFNIVRFGHRNAFILSSKLICKASALRHSAEMLKENQNETEEKTRRHK